MKPPKKYTAKELEALEEARILAVDLIRDDKYFEKDHFLMRFLKAQNMNVKSALKMGQEAHLWRMNNRIDSIMTEKYEEFAGAYKYQGHDLEGRPIVLLSPMDIDVRVQLNKGARESMIRCYIQMFEKGLQHFKNDSPLMTNGDEVTKVVAIADFTGCSFRKHASPQCFPFYFEMITILRDYYPQCIKYVIGINVNRALLPFMEIFRPFMTAKSKKALKVFGTNKANWSKFLHTIIAPDQLPERFGGIAGPTINGISG